MYYVLVGRYLYSMIVCTLYAYLAAKLLPPSSNPVKVRYGRGKGRDV
jgi:hypothetical protein